MRDREQSVETLRGLAVLLLVSGHVIGLDSASGMRVAADSGWRYFTDSFAVLRMPLFTVISGYVYDLRPVKRGEVTRFMNGKMRRLLLPAMGVATLQFLMKAVVPGVHSPARLSEIWRIYLFPFDHFWFVHALMLVFALVALLDAFEQLRSWSGWLGVFVAAVMACLFARPATRLFALPGALNLLPLFMFGVGIHRFSAVFARRMLPGVALLVFAIASAAHQARLFGWLSPDHVTASLIGVAAGTSGCFLLFRFRRSLRPLAFIGSYALAIYLWHVFGAAGARVLLGHLGIDAPWIVLGCGLACGIGGPIAGARLLERYRATLRPFPSGQNRDTREAI